MVQLQAQKNQQNQTNKAMAVAGPVALDDEPPCPGADQSVETRTLEGHPWKADEYCIGILP